MGRCPGVRFSGWGEKKNLGRPQGQEKNQGISFKNGRIRTSNSLFCTHGMHFITNESQKFSANAGRDPFSLLLYLITGLSCVNINVRGRGATEGHFSIYAMIQASYFKRKLKEHESIYAMVQPSYANHK